jgi:3-methylcrotonyl-CoA carboxylase alpha subunit
VVIREGDEHNQEKTVAFDGGFVSPNIIQIIRDDRSQFFYCMQHKNTLYLFMNHTGFLFEVIDPFKVDKPIEALPKEVLESPMPGIIRQVFVKVGDNVAMGTPLIALEAMKMEHTLKAPYAGVVTKICYKEGDTVEGQVALLDLKRQPDAKTMEPEPKKRK